MVSRFEIGMPTQKTKGWAALRIYANQPTNSVSQFYIYLLWLDACLA